MKLRIALLFCSACLSGCGTWPGWLPMSGPSREQVEMRKTPPTLSTIRLVPVTDDVARQLSNSRKQPSFSESFGAGQP